MSPLIPFLLLLLLPSTSHAACANIPCTALASYFVSQGQNLTTIGSLFGIEALADLRSQIPLYNPSITSVDSIPSDAPVNIPFTCKWSDGGSFLAGDFLYTILTGDTYDSLARDVYKNLTTVDWLMRRNKYPKNNIPDHAITNVTVNCSCGDGAVSRDYGLFVTYPLRRGDTLKSVAESFGLGNLDLLQSYNKGMDFSSGAGIVFVPFRDKNGSYYPLPPCKRGISGGSIAGISVAAGVSLLIFVVLFVIYKRKKGHENSLHRPLRGESAPRQDVSLSMMPGEHSPVNGITVDKSVEFSYEELAAATHDFSMANKIGQGGFGAVYYAELRGERTAVKMMAMKSTKEFSAELQVLTRVHHLNLVRLVGYCTTDSLFLIYEYMENGNLSQHLHDSAQVPLSWAARVQIALDSARGLEYIHEHTVPVFIHRDIKSANILLDTKFRAKVADFGLTKLSQAKNTSKDESAKTQFVVGTFGYMPPDFYQMKELLLVTNWVLFSAQVPLSWAARVQIALDSARGLEYIHEHTVPVFIHRDVKSANILLDTKFRAKVADFGLTKLSQAKNTSKDESAKTQFVVGTFGYMPPEYAQYGDVSPKIDVFAFGVILYELISAKKAVYKTSSGGDETRGLVSLFDDVFNHPNPKEELCKVIDPRLEDYPIDDVFKMAELGRACTKEDPHLRPNMRAVVVALMMLSSATGDWDLGQFYGKNTYAHLMSGR